MKILLSPAKSLDYTSEYLNVDHSIPVFEKDVVKLKNELKNYSVKDIKSLMSVSENLAQLNVDRFNNFNDSFNLKNSRPAIYAFAGDVYTGLDAYSLNKGHIIELNKRLRILSGLYGVLKPLDLMQPYRLEMGTKLTIGESKNLYEFWGDRVTQQLNKELENEDLVINLASNEYFKVINKKLLTGKLISPVFKDFKNGKLKIIAFYAKKARGLMTRFIIEQDCKSLEDLKGFNLDDYRYSAQHTVKDSEPVFIR